MAQDVSQESGEDRGSSETALGEGEDGKEWKNRVIEVHQKVTKIGPIEGCRTIIALAGGTLLANAFNVLDERLSTVRFRNQRIYPSGKSLFGQESIGEG